MTEQKFDENPGVAGAQAIYFAMANGDKAKCIALIDEQARRVATARRHAVKRIKVERDSDGLVSGARQTNDSEFHVALLTLTGMAHALLRNSAELSALVQWQQAELVKVP